MRQRTKPQSNIVRRLAGQIEFRDGQYIFVPAEPPKKKKIVYVPYWNQD